MAGATLEKSGDGQGAAFHLRGTLDFACVPALLDAGRSQFPATGTVRIDLAGIDAVNSAGLAVLLEWQREFSRSGRTLELVNVPRTLVNIAHVSELETVLALPA